jgi:Mn-dependent DtxR family transcriptional regulator
MTDTLDGALSETNLSAAMLDALTGLADAVEPMAPRELAAHLSCSFAEIAALLDALDAQGLIERAGAGIALTPQGQAVSAPVPRASARPNSRSPT